MKKIALIAILIAAYLQFSKVQDIPPDSTSAPDAKSSVKENIGQQFAPLLEQHQEALNVKEQVTEQETLPSNLDGGNYQNSTSPLSNQSEVIQSNDQQFATAFAQHQNNIQIEGHGTVSRILPDDIDGSKHQKFIVQLANGQTLLLAHNIDLAPRINDLSEGNPISFYGEYEWNPKGGIVHWTHHDPDGQHVAGWIKHNGNLYQ